MAFFCTVFSVNFENEARWMSGKYDHYLKLIDEKMRKIEAEHGLSKDEYFTSDNLPELYRILDQQYNEVLNRKKIELFSEFGFHKYAKFYKNDKTSFDKRFEDIKKIMSTSSKKDTLSELTERLSTEAVECAKFRA